MKIAFYAPLKRLTHPVPSGDREIALSLVQFFKMQQAKVKVSTEFESISLHRRPLAWIWAGVAFVAAFGRNLFFGPDLFFTYHHYYKAPDLIQPWLSLLMKKPYFIFEGMYSENSNRSGYHLAWQLTRWGLLRATHVFTDKPGDIAGLQKILPASRISYAPPALDCDFFKPSAQLRKNFRDQHRISKDAVVLICVAMLRDDRKTEGVRFLLDCLQHPDFLAATSKSNPQPVHLVLIGGGDCATEIEARVQSLSGIRGIFLDQQSREVIREALCGSDLFVFPGIDESLGLVYLEAQACGLPCVAFDNGGVGDSIATGTTGLLTTLLDGDEYRKAIQTLIQDTSLREVFSLAARERILQKFNRNIVYAQMWSQINSSLNKERPK